MKAFTLNWSATLSSLPLPEPLLALIGLSPGRFIFGSSIFFILPLLFLKITLVDVIQGEFTLAQVKQIVAAGYYFSSKA